MKSISVTFDTVVEMISDETLSSGMTVTCLGYDKINDHNGGMYRIFSSLESESEKAEDDITISDSLFARKIENDLFTKIKDMSDRLDKITKSTKELNTKVDELISQYHINTPSDDDEEVIDDSVSIESWDINDKVLDLMDLAGVKFISSSDESKTIFIDRFKNMDDNVLDVITFDTISPDGTKYTVNGEDWFDIEQGKIYINSHGDMFTTNVTNYEELTEEEIDVLNTLPFATKVDFKADGSTCTITLDNVNGDYDSYIPKSFDISNTISVIDFRNGLKVERKFVHDLYDYEHPLFDFTISRENVPTAISYN